VFVSGVPRSKTNTMEEPVMLRVETFHSDRTGTDPANVRTAIASTTQQANAAMTAWQQRSSAVHVLAASAQLALDGEDAAYVLTLVVDLQPAEDDENKRVTYEDAAFE
jgi:hypothetical protein